MLSNYSIATVLRQLLLMITLLAQAVTGTAAQDRLKVEIVPQIAHSSSGEAVAFSPNGSSILSGSRDNTLQLWDAATGKLLRSFKGHSGNSAAFSPDGRNVLSGSWGYTLNLWEAETGKLLRTFEGHSGEVSSVAFSPDGRSVLSGSWDDTLKLWDAATGRLLRTFEGHSDSVTSVAFSPDGRSIISGSHPGDWPNDTLKLWDVATGKLLRNFDGHSLGVNSVAFSPDGRSVLSGSWSKTLRLWEAATGKLLRTFEGHSSEVRSVAFSPDGRSVLSGSEDKTLNLWDAETGKLLGTFKGHSREVRSVAFSPDGLNVLSGSYDKTLRLWDAATTKHIRTFEGHSSSVHSVTFSVDGRSVLLGGDKTVELWDAATGKQIRTFEGHRSGLNSVAFSPDGRSVLSGSGQYGYWHDTLKLWDAATGKLLRTFAGISGSVHSVAFRSDGRMALTGSGYTLKLWDAEAGKLVRTFKGHLQPVSSVAFSPDGRNVLSGSGDHTLKLWDAATGKQIRTFEGHRSGVNSVAFSPDGRNVLSGSDDETLKLWDAASGRLLRTFEGHSSKVHSVAFSPDGLSVLSGSGGNGCRDCSLKLWDAATGKLLRTFEGHSGEVSSVAFSPDGRRVLSGSRDTTMRIWSASSGTEIARFFAGKKDDWLTMTPAGFFDFGGEPEKLLHVVRGMEVITVGQLFKDLYRPDLVAAALQGDLEGQHAEAAAKLNLKEILDSGPAPQIEHLADKDERAGDSVRIALRLTGTGGGVGPHITWKVNGVTQGVTTPATLAEAAKEALPLASVVFTDTLRLVPGQVNIVEVTAYNRAELVATPPFRITVDAFGTTTSVRPRMFVLAVGVNSYRMPNYQLRYAATDATRLAKALEVVGSSLFAEVRTIILIDEQVSEAGISTSIEKVAQTAKPEDVFVLFLGGHGKSIAGRYYYYPQTLDFSAGQSVEKFGIGQDKWEAWLAKITVQKSLLVIDTCEGDAFRGSRGGTDAARQTAMNQLQYATGRNVISAARDAAYEGYNGHGVLTYAILEALDAKVPGGEERIGVGALALHVGMRVPEITQSLVGLRQLPTHKLFGNDFPIGIRQPVLTGVSAEAPIPKEATHVVIRPEVLRQKPEATAPGSRTLAPGTQVRAVEFVGTWAIVARDGQKLGYVPVEALARIQ